jgi:opacity protein-like surface antigen
MKKILMIAVMMIGALSASAEDGKLTFGVDGNLGISSDSRFGIGVRAQYLLTENFRAEAKGIYYPKKYEVTQWNALGSLEYLIPVADKTNVYPIVGAGVMLCSGSVLDNFSYFTYHGGVGAEYNLTDKFKIDCSLLYQGGKKDDYKADWLLLSLGVAYRF